MFNKEFINISFNRVTVPVIYKHFYTSLHTSDNMISIIGSLLSRKLELDNTN